MTSITGLQGLLISAKSMVEAPMARFVAGRFVTANGGAGDGAVALELPDGEFDA